MLEVTLFNGMSASENVSFILVFLEGILSFFSPCILPLIPVYISYLAGNGKKINSDGIIYDRKTVLLNTLFFIAGISVTFFILGLSFSALRLFFSKNRLFFSRLGGIIILLLGLVQLNIIKLNFLNIERKIHIEYNSRMNPILAFIMGFSFSFAWTPCVGPALSSVLILSSNANSTFAGNMLIFIYSLGFILPFIFLGLFTTQVLNFLNKNKFLFKYTVRFAGLILVIMGILTYTGMVNNLSRYFSFIK